MKNKRTLLLLLHIIVPIILGTCIYLFTRPDTYISKWILDWWGISSPAVTLRGLVPWWLWRFLCSYAADILWAYALTFSVYLIFCSSPVKILPYMAICCIFEAGMELLQLFDVLSGTFDVWDIILEVCATAIASLIIKQYRRKQS